MFYIGVDIAKNNHEASIIDSDGKLVSESFSFSNSIRGLEKFQKFISSFSIDSNNCIIGMEATGHYWLSLFSNIYGVASKELLSKYPLPEDMISIPADELAKMLSKCSKGRFGIDKAKEIQEKASNSFGVKFALKSFSFQIKQIIAQISFLEDQIADIEDEISSMINSLCPVITSITGIGDVLGAAIFSEIGDISRFERANQLVAYAGLDVAVKQSGNFNATDTKISKRGSPYLRRAIWLAANVAAFKDPALSLYYQKLRQRGKAHGTAIGAVARKLTNIIFAVLRDNKAYVPNI